MRNDKTVKLLALLSCLLGALVLTPAAAQSQAESAGDLQQARALFDANLDAIRQRDAEAYRSCYLDSPKLVRTGPDGPVLGIENFVAPDDDSWPQALHAFDIRLVPVRPGVVYGSYRYRVVFDGVPAEGLSERLFVSTPDGWRIAVTTAFAASSDISPPALALVGGTLIDGSGKPPVPNSVVVLRNGYVECAGIRQECPVDESLDRKDISGSWVIPGLVDAHVHFSQTGWVDGRPDAVDLRREYPYSETVAWLQENVAVLFRSYLYNGVTAVFDVGGFPWTWALGEMAEDDPLAPHVAAAGPLLSTLAPEILSLPEQVQLILMEDEEAIEKTVRSHAAFGADAIKVWFIVQSQDDLPELSERLNEAGAAAKKAGLRLIVHATGLEDAKAALRAGAKLLVHGIDDQPVDEEFLELALRNQTICTPTLTVREGYVQVFRRHWDPTGVPQDGLDEMTLARARATNSIAPESIRLPSLEAWEEGVAKRHQQLMENTRRMHQAGIRLAVGTDAGNPLTLHGASIFNELEAMARAGLSPSQVLLAATAHGAEAMGRDDLGTLENGKIADLLVLDADPLQDVAHLRRIRAVVRRGSWIPREELLPLPQASAANR